MQIFNRPLSHIVFYIIAFVAVYVANKIEPTSLAGPGLDFLVLLVCIVLIVVLLVRTLITKNIEKSSRLMIVCIHGLAIALMIWGLNQPT